MKHNLGMLGDKKLLDILLFFADDPSLEVSQTQIRKAAHLSRATGVKWLRKLEKMELLSVKRIGVTKLYSLNAEDPIVKQIKIMSTLFRLRGLKEIFAKHQCQVYLYGSCARGEDKKGSDIDLLVIGKVKREDIIRSINDFSEKISKSITLQIFSESEWVDVSRKDKPFYERAEKDKIRLC